MARDVVVNPLGKSGGALIQQILVFWVGNLLAATLLNALDALAPPLHHVHLIYRHVADALPPCRALPWNVTGERVREERREKRGEKGKREGKG